MEELELSEQCRQGNNHARKELYEQYAGRMLGICLRYAGDRDTAQDLLHDSFIKIFDSFDKFTWRGEGSLRAWMERVVVNIALQYLRKNDVINQAASLEELPEEYEEPDASDVEAIPQKVLMQFIEELPAGYRTVFNLYTFEDKSHKEIAQVLGINEKSSATHMNGTLRHGAKRTLLYHYLSSFIVVVQVGMCSFFHVSKRMAARMKGSPSLPKEVSMKANWLNIMRQASKFALGIFLLRK